MHIGKRIKYLRRKGNIKMDYLGKGIVSTAHLSNIEAGRYTPSVDILSLISKKLDVEEVYLQNFNQYDETIEELITRLERSILYNSTDSQDLILQIERRGPILNIYQELHFFLLKASYYLKSKNYKELKHSEILINSYIDKDRDDSLPGDLKKRYYYYLGLKTYYNNDLDGSFNYFSKLTSISNNNDNNVFFKYNLALISKKKNNYIKALNYANEALELCIKDQIWGKMAECYNFIGVTYWEQKDFNEALLNLKRAEKIYDLIQDTKLQARILHNLGLVFKANNEDKDAILCFKNAIELKKKNNCSPIISYRALIDLHLKNNNLNLAIAELENAKLEMASNTDYHLLQMLTSDILVKKGDLESSITILKDCIPYFEEKNDLYFLKNLYKDIGYKYFTTKKYKLAALYYKKVLDLMGE